MQNNRYAQDHGAEKLREANLSLRIQEPSECFYVASNLLLTGFDRPPVP